MILIEAAWILSAFGIDEGFDILEKENITSESKMNQERTKYKMMIAKESRNNAETAAIDFYELLGDITISEKVAINPDVLLPEWCGILKSIKRQNEIKKKQIEAIREK